MPCTHICSNPTNTPIKGTSFHCHFKFSTACLDHVIQDNMNEQQNSNQIPSTTASNADCIHTLITTLPQFIGTCIYTYWYISNIMIPQWIPLHPYMDVCCISYNCTIGKEEVVKPSWLPYHTCIIIKIPLTVQ